MAHATPLSRRSLLAISDAAVAGASAVGTSGALAQAVSPNPDAELLRLGQEHDVALARAIDAEVELLSDEEFNDICEQYTDIEFAIQEVPAQTWEGVVVKARIAAEYAEE